MTYKIQKSFSCAHFYHQPQWDHAKNRDEFGKCFTKFGHGHDYTLQFKFTSEKPQAVLDSVNELIERLDHQHLNFVIAEFQTQIPTTENLALYLRHELLKILSLKNVSAELTGLNLQETSEIWVELP